MRSALAAARFAALALLLSACGEEPAASRDARLASAQRRIRLSSARSSAFRRPEALESCSAFNELEQTNSA